MDISKAPPSLLLMYLIRPTISPAGGPRDGPSRLRRRVLEPAFYPTNGVVISGRSRGRSDDGHHSKTIELINLESLPRRAPVQSSPDGAVPRLLPHAPRTSAASLGVKQREIIFLRRPSRNVVRNPDEPRGLAQKSRQANLRHVGARDRGCRNDFQFHRELSAQGFAFACLRAWHSRCGDTSADVDAGAIPLTPPKCGDAHSSCSEDGTLAQRRRGRPEVNNGRRRGGS